MNQRLDGQAHDAVVLPAVVEQLLVDLVADGFQLYRCGPKAEPNALVVSYEWQHCLDLLTIRDFDRVTAARVPKRGSVDVFAPQAVVWAYEGPPQQALRALLKLVHPAHPDAPTGEYPAPAGLHVPRAQQRPMTIRPPSPARARVRAARLASELTIPGWPSVESEREPPTRSRLPAVSRLHHRDPETEMHHARRLTPIGLDADADDLARRPTPRTQRGPLGLRPAR